MLRTIGQRPHSVLPNSLRNGARDLELGQYFGPIPKGSYRSKIPEANLIHRLSGVFGQLDRSAWPEHGTVGDLLLDLPPESIQLSVRDENPHRNSALGAGIAHTWQNCYSDRGESKGGILAASVLTEPAVLSDPRPIEINIFCPLAAAKAKEIRTDRLGPPSRPSPAPRSAIP
jgi:hypothetical protein